MSVILVFLLVIAGFAGWWLSHQRLMAKPWLEQGLIGDAIGLEGSPLPTAKIGLGVFLAVVGCLFALFTSAYFMRMALSDWQALPLPRVLWFNTGVLVLSSIALQCASVAARRGEIDAVRLGLVTAGLTALAFLGGQLVAWRELTADGYLLTANPANSFFYLITGMHGLHILGGLVGLGRTTAGAWNGARPERLRLSVELCAMYWHFLLFVWLAIFALLAGWAATFIEICRQLLI
ncbi:MULTISPECIES: cytochrome c oxidase subunit 3 [unclassified Mesorhizobium]|uniref:cytochrome c oxidase subunit 3 n=1 Tax=unclassified Mesorhizobium TaxID=325217 RepID=UPI000FE8FE1B|nr:MULTISPECIES: cytochrome c oxidase subunit 3 [unclassified Mesorhizobium]RWI27749.1 MAG: cytochrome-c oxidase [Mesorhizobium sp.]RWK46332.1 MAG: cytochrome-c oxidase [Mesorhizobium sp.]RWK89125.1 MAG: cytochrome-c oxidase [Mesorhizobium sp.]TIQ20003.1 MAG: cytochrome-c oxidase [Mesorhizobium sp.]TIQ27085.1 MAG: cytochrome-c oxidase [Mesorhizobium sp.]